MPIRQIAIGRPHEATHPDTLKAALAEFFSTLIFVFAGEGSGMAFAKLTGGGPSTPSGLVAASIAHAFGLFVAVAVGANISGGHVNPAVTFGAFVGGNISLLRGILYWIAQLLGSVAACFLLKFSTGGLETSGFSLSGVGALNALVFEIVMTFGPCSLNHLKMLQAALSFQPSTLPRVTPSKTLVSPLRSISAPRTSLCPSIKATAVANEALMVDYSSMASVFPAEACETIGGDACNVEMYPEVKLNSAPRNNMPRTALERVEREYLEYNDPKTVFLGEACDDLGGEFCEPEYLRGVH